MLNKIKKLFLIILSPIWQYFKILNFNKVLNLKNIDENGIYLYDLPKENSKIYLFKLLTNNDIFQPLDFANLKRRLQESTKAQLYYFLIKQQDYEMCYIATFCEKTANEFKDSMKLSLCNNTEVINFILDIYNINKYNKDEDNLMIKSSLNVNSIKEDDLFDAFFYNFRRIISDGAYIQNREYKLFQVVRIFDKSVIPQKEVIAKDFNGIFFSYIDLSKSRLESYLKDYIAYAKRINRRLVPAFSNLEDIEKRGVGDSLVANIMFYTQTREQATDMASKFGFEIVEKDGLDKLYINKKTPLLTREIDYDLLVPAENLSKIFGIRTKKNITLEDLKKSEKAWTKLVIDFYGRNMYGSYVNFCFRLNANPHFCLIAGSGSGKSVVIQKIVSLIQRIDFEKKIAKRWNETKIRYFEIGRSSSKLQKFLKSIYGDEVGLIEGNFSGMNFSLCDVEVQVNENGFRSLSKESKTIAMQLLNVALKEYGVGILNASEQSLYEKALEDVYVNKHYKGLTIRDLKHLSEESYKEKLELFAQKGYRDDTWLHEIKDCGNIENLTKPMLKDIVNQLELSSGSTYLNKQEKTDYATLIKKINAISGVESNLYGSLNSLVFDDKTFYAIEFDNIKENQRLLRTLFVFILVQLYNKDVKSQVELARTGKKMKQIVYIFEEIRNFFEDNPEIVKLAKIIVFEGRKFQIQGIFAGQEVAHFPDGIIGGCKTIGFLKSAVPETNQQLKKDLLKIYKDLDSVEYLVEELEFRTLGLISDLGTFSCKLDINDKELEMFSV